VGIARGQIHAQASQTDGSKGGEEEGRRMHACRREGMPYRLAKLVSFHRIVDGLNFLRSREIEVFVNEGATKKMDKVVRGRGSHT
jgi:hypothetical protein